MTDTNMEVRNDNQVDDEQMNFDVNKFKKLLESNSSQDVVELNCLVKQIIEKGQLDAFKCLLEQGYKLDVLNDKRQTALHLLFNKAAQIINYKISNRLLYNSIGDVNYTDSQGLSLLHIASYLGIVDKVKDFLENKEDKNAIFHYRSSSNAKTRFTPLHLAALNHQLSTVKLLLKYGANVCPRNDQSVTPLHLAAGNYYYTFHPNCEDHKNVDVDVLKILIRHQSNLNAQDELGNTPLMSVYSKFFFGKCGQLEEENEDSETESQTENNNPGVKIGELQKQKLKILLKFGADVTLKNNTGDTILHRVISDLQSLRCAYILKEISFEDQSHLDMVKMILHSNPKIDINSENNLGATPLQLAVSYMSVDVIQILLSNGAVFQKVRLDFEVVNCFWHHREYPTFETVKNLLSAIHTLEGAGFLLDRHDKLAVMKFLVHDTNDCKCCDKNLLDKFKKENLLYYGSVKHIKLMYKKVDETIDSHLTKIQYFLPIIMNVKIMLKYFYTEPDFEEVLDLIQSMFKTCVHTALDDPFNEFANLIADEIAKMASIKFQSNISLYDILNKDPKDIYYYIHDADYSLFDHLYCSRWFLKGHFTKSLVHHYVKEMAEEFVENFLYPDLPVVCSDNIIKYLENEDILKLCLAANIKEHKETD